MWAGICALFWSWPRGYIGGTNYLLTGDDAGITGTPPDRGRCAKTAPSAVTVSKDQKININTAALDDLQRLPNCGPQDRGKLEYRKEVGGKFDSPNDLAGISGIGVKN